MRRWLGIWLLALGWLALGVAYLRWLGPLTSPLVWEQGGRHYQLLEPRALGFALLVPAFLLVLYRSLADLPWQQRLLSTLFRSAFVLLLALCVGRLVRSVESSRVCTVFLVDVSDSISDAALSSASQTIDQARAARRPDDELRVISFARRPRLLEPGPDGQLPPWREPAQARPSGDDRYSETDLQAALQLAYGVFPEGYLRRVVLL